MGLGRALSVALAASWSERRRYAECVAELARAAVDLRLRRFRDLVHHLEQVDGAGTGPELTPDQAAEAERCAAAVRRCARNVPWEALCLCQALALSRMLGRRGVGGLVTLGSRFVDDPAVDGGRSLVAHAWVTASDQVLLGGEESPTVYAGLVSYRWRGS